MTTSEAASLLGLTRYSVIRFVHDGKITPAVKAPGDRGAFMFKREDVEALAESREAAR